MTRVKADDDKTITEAMLLHPTQLVEQLKPVELIFERLKKAAAVAVSLDALQRRQQELTAEIDTLTATLAREREQHRAELDGLAAELRAKRNDTARQIAKLDESVTQANAEKERAEAASRQAAERLNEAEKGLAAFRAKIS